MQQNLSRFYEFESAEKVCHQFNNLISTLKKEEEHETGEKYPWLDKTNERKYYAVREILEKHVNLDSTCLSEEEKKCPNIQVGIDVIDKLPFFIRPYHVREEDKKVIGKEMRC